MKEYTKRDSCMTMEEVIERNTGMSLKAFLTPQPNPYIEVQEIEKSIYKLKESHDILYPVLVSIAETHKDMFDFCKDQN